MIIKSTSCLVEEQDKPIIFINDFDNEANNDFIKRFTELENDKNLISIIINISSYGGEINCLMSMVDLINSSSKNIITICSGGCHSAASILVSSGTKGYRYMNPSAIFHVHSVQYSTRGSAEELQNEAKNTTRINNLYLELLAKNSKLNKTQIKKHLKENAGEWYLNAKQALEYGFIDKIGSPRLISSLTLELING